MKVLILVAAFAALTATVPAGATHDGRSQPISDTTTAAVISDAGRLGSASLTALNGGTHWTPAQHQAQAGNEFDAIVPQVDTGMLLVGLVGLALLLYRPLGRALRRQEQQRRATALASTLDHAPRG